MSLLLVGGSAALTRYKDIEAIKRYKHPFDGPPKNLTNAVEGSRTCLQFELNKDCKCAVRQNVSNFLKLQHNVLAAGCSAHLYLDLGSAILHW